MDPEPELAGSRRGWISVKGASPAARSGKFANLSSGDGVPAPVASRLRIVALSVIGAALACAAYSTLSETMDGWLFALMASVIAGSAVVAAVAARSPGRRALRRLGIAFVLGVAVAVAAAESRWGLSGGSFAGAWIVFTPLLVPCAPRRMAVLAALAASAGPLVYGLILLGNGGPVPSAAIWVMAFLPSYVAAIMAYAAARYVSNLRDELSEPRQAGIYDLVERIGRGTMGEVWRGRHRLLARPAAIKLIRRHGREKPDAQSVRRFEREALVTSSLQSSHTVSLYDFGVTREGDFYYVMELLEGMTLGELVETHGPLPPSRVVHILRQALDSLAEAHARGLVHRDIEPGNIHIGRRGLHHDHVKVLDFGLVSVLADRGAGVGDELAAPSAAWCRAPELDSEGDDVDGRADVYALGRVAQYMSSGRRELSPDDAGQPSTALAALIASCVAERPADRPTAVELERQLTRIELPEWRDDSAREWWERHSTPPPLSGAREIVDAMRERAWALARLSA